MAKMTLEDLKKLREEKKSELNKRESAGKDVQIIVGMGTCGIAAGAKESLDAFLKTLEEERLGNVLVKQTGCMGLCAAEPTVEVIVPNMPTIIYGKVDAAVARQIVKDHIVRKTLVNGHIYDRPSTDILKEEG